MAHHAVYTDLIISTIVDMRCQRRAVCSVYTDLIISTIVDGWSVIRESQGLYGLDNFYYRRFLLLLPYSSKVYKDLIISTIVDCYHGKQDIAWSIKT